MKKILILLTSLIFFLSTLTYINTNILKQMVVEGPAMLDEDNYQIIMKEIVTFTPIYDIVPKELHSEVDKVIADVTRDERVQDIMMTQSNNALSDIIHGTNSFSEAAVADDIMTLLDDYTTEIEDKTHNLITKDQIRNELEKQLIGFNVSKKYEKVLEKVESKISPKHLKILNVAYKVTDNMKLITLTSLIAAVVSFLILLLTSKKARFITPIITAILIVVNWISLPFIISTVFNKLGLDPTGINPGAKVIVQALVLTIILSIIGFGLNLYQTKQSNIE